MRQIEVDSLRFAKNRVNDYIVRPCVEDRESRIEEKEGGVHRF